MSQERDDELRLIEDKMYQKEDDKTTSDDWNKKVEKRDKGPRG